MLNKIKSISLLFLCAFLFASCQDNYEVQSNITITSPVENNIHHSDEKILLASNLKRGNVFWKSSIDGELGSGTQIFTFLSNGKHLITFFYPERNITMSVSVNVIEREDKKNLPMIINELPKEIRLSGDISYCGFCALQGNCNNLSAQRKTLNDSARMAVQYDAKNISPPIRDVSIECNSQLNLNLAFSSKGSRAANNMSPSMERTFFVANTVRQNEAHNVLAELYYDSDGFQIYVEKSVLDSGLYNDNINRCIENLVSIISSRLNFIWGNCADIDDSGSLSILFSSTLNVEKTAIGFFNPNDFFVRDADTSSSEYNPHSNEMDIIYVGIPVSADDENFSVNSISATLAHEITHAINFSQRVIFPRLCGLPVLEPLDVFLDEGLSHLSESLCGFGVSGGNSRFVDYYLADSENYSLWQKDRFGNFDSAGQRGAICYFLYWLFEKSGGRIWDEDNLNWTDSGGISFLRKIANSEKSAWESIGEAFGSSTDLLFLEFAGAVLSDSIKNEGIDPATGEYVFAHGNISSSEFESGLNMIPYSITKKNLILSGDDVLYLNGSDLFGQIYFFESLQKPPIK